MKMLVFLVLVLTAVVFAEEKIKPTVWMTSDTDSVVYYSIPVKNPDNFNIVFLEWGDYKARFKYGWTVKEGQWVRVKVGEGKDEGKQRRLPIYSLHFRNSRSTLIIENRALSSGPVKK